MQGNGARDGAGGIEADCIDYVVGWDEIVWSTMNVRMPQKGLELTT